MGTNGQQRATRWAQAEHKQCVQHRIYQRTTSDSIAGINVQRWAANGQSDPQRAAERSTRGSKAVDSDQQPTVQVSWHQRETSDSRAWFDTFLSYTTDMKSILRRMSCTRCANKSPKRLFMNPTYSVCQSILVITRIIYHLTSYHIWKIRFTNGFINVFKP